MSRPFEGDLVRVRRNPWILGLAMSPFLATIACLVSGALGSVPAAVLMPYTLMLGVVLALTAWRRNARPVATEVRVHADPAGVTLTNEASGRRTHIRRDQVSAGLVLPGLAPRVVLRRRFRPTVELQLTTTNEARALLRAIGLDASQTVASFRTLSRMQAKRRYGLGIAGLNAALFFLFVATSRAAPIGFVLLVASSVVSAILSALPTRFDVGADGVVLRWLGRSRFIGYDRIRAVTRFDRRTTWGRSAVRGVSLDLRSGEEVAVPVTSAGWSDPGEIAVIEERIRQAMETFRLGGTAADAAMLRRGGRGVRDWIVALRSLGAGANADMRTAPVGRERLFRIVEDPSLAPVDRAAAAVALGGDLDDEGRARLDAVAGAIAAPKLRFALEKAATAPDAAELEAALAELDEAPDAKRAKA
jgi:hypothetical protein